MVTEIKDDLFNKETKLRIKLLLYVDSNDMKLSETPSIIEEFDFYRIIEKSNNKRIIIQCWNKGDKLEQVRVYIATYEKED